MVKISVKNIDETFKKLSADLKASQKTQAVPMVKRMVEELVSATPVDTGLARSSWTVTEKPNGFDVTNTTEYIEYLNAGSSKQAPAYFIEETALKYGKPLGTIVQVRGR